MHPLGIVDVGRHTLPEPAEQGIAANVLRLIHQKIVVDQCFAGRGIPDGRTIGEHRHHTCMRGRQ